MSKQQRSQARHHAVQALYQWQMTGQNVAEIDSQFLAEEDINNFEVAYFREILHGVPSHVGELDGHLGPCLDRSIESVDPVERAILRLATFELTRHQEIPYRVVINEAVELAKVFGAEKSHKFVNGVLDRLARNVRAAEIKPRERGV
jgi:transcription antitermination protein NusB